MCVWGGGGEGKREFVDYWWSGRVIKRMRTIMCTCSDNMDL